LAGNPDGKRQLERIRHRWEENDEIDLREIGWSDMDWMNLAQDRAHWRVFVNRVMNFRVAEM
jgi:hypothetical protein